MLSDDTNYVDTGGTGQGSILLFQDVEDNSEQEADEGWYSETSVQSDYRRVVELGADPAHRGWRATFARRARARPLGSRRRPRAGRPGSPRHASLRRAGG